MYYRVCHTILSDHGSVFISQMTKTIRSRMCIQHRLCMRTNTQGSRGKDDMTPFIDGFICNWDQLFLSIMFAINLSVRSTLGYVHMKLCSDTFHHSFHYVSNMKSLPSDKHDYMHQFSRKLETVWNCVRQNTVRSKQTMIARANRHSHIRYIE